MKAFAYLLYGPEGVYWDRIVLVVAAVTLILGSLFSYEAFVSGPAGRRKEALRLAKKSRPEIVVLLARNCADPSLPDWEAISASLAPRGIIINPSILRTIDATFGYTVGLHANELNRRTTYLDRNIREEFAEFIVAVASVFQPSQSRTVAVRLIDALPGGTALKARKSLAENEAPAPGG